MEIWNLVFMQYERDAKGLLSPLPKPSIDTGMGLERTASILQGVDTNYEIDLFAPIFEAIWKAAKLRPEARRDVANRIASQVVADHIRAATFMCYDGVVPSNEGRGYVLRKIVRRALRFGRKLGIEGLFFAELAPAVFQAMGDQYPELLGELGRIQKSLHREEQQFSHTLSAGLKILEGSDVTTGTLAGSDIFRLYDTYGFPVDLVEDWCRERGIAADLAGFQQELNAQRTRARAAMKAHDLRLAGDLAILADLPPTRFTGYDQLESQAHVVALFDAGHLRVKQLVGEGYVLLDRTPFYALSGGQVGDTGQLRFEGGHAEVLDCTAPAQKRHLHKVLVTGTLVENMAVNALVHPIRRRRIRAHHTATHLLHAALREVLGTHVKQAGSVVDASHLRFDFTHFAPLDAVQIGEIERLASVQALRSMDTEVREMDIEEALTSGAMALFGEKYGDVVRVVKVPGFSTELCGGTHVPNTGEIGVVKITSEGAVAAGVRRIEAVAGEMALALLQTDEAMIHGLSRLANANRESLPEWLAAKDQRIAQLERELKEAKLKAASGGGKAEQVEQIQGVTLVTAIVEGLEGNALREFMDQVRTRHTSAVIVLASTTAEDKVAALVAVSPDLPYDAGALFKVMLPALHGRGGGKRDLAQGGGTHPAGLPEALALLRAAL
jgi:alanyl-tRNA synthetase